MTDSNVEPTAFEHLPHSVTLSPDQWHELFENLDVAEQFIPGAERRESERYPFSQDTLAVVEFVREDTGHTYQVRCRNISETGVGFIHQADEPAGTDVAVILPLTDGGAMRVTGVVARSELVSDGVYDIGVHFDCSIDPFGVTHVMGGMAA